MSLEADALHLSELDCQIVRAFDQANSSDLVRALGQYLPLRKNLATRLANDSVAVAEDISARDVLTKISAGHGLPSDALIEQLCAKNGTKESIFDLDDEDVEELGSDLFYSWFSHHEYVRGLFELRPLILRQTVPEPVSNLVREARDCYAFQQYSAAYALCRMVIEGSIRDICSRKQLFLDLGPDVILIEKFSWGKLRDKVSNEPLKKRLDELYKDICELIHARKRVSKEEARDAFKETLSVVEQLYQEHGL